MSNVIMVVDDEEMNLALMKRIIERLGRVAETFQSSEEALEKFTDQPKAYSVVITDQTMPKVTGIELAREIKAISPQTQVVLISGTKDLPSDIVDKEHLAAYLIKPISLGEIEKLVKSL